jgi:hypothetical protein
LVNPRKNYECIENIRFVNQNKNKILIVRGLLAYGILWHCFSVRTGVDYGCP